MVGQCLERGRVARGVRMTMSELQVGQRIPGSRCYRDFCDRCGEALRVSGDRLKQLNYCEECDPGQPPAPNTNLTYRMRLGLQRTS